MFECALVLLALAVDPTAKVASAEELRILRTFREEFVELTPGRGRYPAELQRTGGEKVKLAGDYRLAKYETTQELWQSVMGSNPSRWKGKRNSAEMMSSAEALAFCRRVTLKLRAAKLIGENQVVRLPTAIEWEYAARAGTTSAYSFGDDAAQLPRYAWFHGNAAGNDPAVGVKEANPWGFYDIHGYLREFTCDELRFAARSGSWKDNADRLTCDTIFPVKTEDRDDALGFRCVLATLDSRFASLPVQPIAQHEFEPIAAKHETLWGEGEFTEGPACDEKGNLFFSDIGNRMLMFDSQLKRVKTYRDPSGRSNGLAFDRAGRLIACEGANTGGGRRISITEADGTVRTLSDRFEGKRFNSPNDLAIDRAGNVYFTDPRYVGEEPRELDFEAVFRVTPEGTTSIATREVAKPNGLGFSPDGKHLYVADHAPPQKGERLLVRFRVQADGTLAEQTVLFRFGALRGIDGLRVDEHGIIFATAGAGATAGVWVFDGEGTLLAHLATPGDPTNCEFDRLPSSDSRRRLYVTTALNATGKKYGLIAMPVLGGSER